MTFRHPTVAPQPRSPRRTGAAAVVFALALAATAQPLLAGGTPATGAITDQLLTPGAGIAPASVGDFISATNALNTSYRFFIEVPPGQTDLQIELFDADLLAGAGDQTEERDRNRDSVVFSRTKYTLFDPSGNRVATRFNYGDENDPASGDNAWLLFFDDDTSGISGGTTFIDNFATAAYDNDDGSGSFATDWIETSDLNDGSGLPNVGDVQIVGGELRVGNQGDVSSPFTNQVSIEREVDLSTFAAAEVSFDFRTDIGVDIISASVPNRDIGDSFLVEASSDGGTTWDVLEEFAGFTGANSGSRSYDITGFIASDTRIRFRVSNRYAGPDEFFYIDDFQIRGTTTANGGNPANGHWELEVDMSGAVNGFIATAFNNNQNDINAFGIRAHDGTSGSGGQEYNIYADSFVNVGINDNDRTRTYDFYPYITNGCNARVNDFEWDGNQVNPPPPNVNVQPYGSLDLSSRLEVATAAAGFTHTNADMSDNNAWQSTSFGGWTSNSTAEDYGIWQMDLDIEDFNDGNYGLVYFTDFSGSPADGVNEPDTSPETQTYRIYFPNDAGGPPSKPYLAQYLTFVDNASAGSNPPVATGLTNRYAVTLRMVNPTGAIGDITFSNAAGNTIAAQFPGSNANATITYQGVSLISQGTVISQPTVGQTTAGSLTWDPGTLSPGDDVSLVYLIDVNWSTLVDVDLTGTPGSSGTTASFIDETGDAVNGRATFSFGDLCQLTVATGTPTPALVSKFGARAAGRATVVEWSTAAEAKTVAFDLYREQDGTSVKVNGAPLTALLTAAQGGTYRFLDPGASPFRDHTYLLVEHEADGGSRTHGPFQVSPTWDGFSDQPSGLERAPHQVPDRYRDRLRLAAAEAADGAGAGGSSGASFGSAETVGGGGAEAVSDAANLFITDSGLYRVTAADLAATLGTDVRSVRSRILGFGYSLTVAGKPVAYAPLPGGAGLEFYGEAVDSPFYAENVYRLAPGAGLAIKDRKGRQPADWGTETFRHTERSEENTRIVTLLDLDPESDLWFWDFLLPGGSNDTEVFAVDTPGAVSSGQRASLTLDLLGAFDGAYRVTVEVNGQAAGEVTFNGVGRVSRTLDVDAADLVDGTNAVTLTAQTGGFVFIDGFEVTYDRLRRPVADALLASAEGSRFPTAAPFTSPAIRVFDLAVPRRPELVPARVLPEAGGFRAVWEAKEDGPYFAVGDAGVLTPTAMEADVPSDLSATHHGADYLVIAPRSLAAGAEALALHRQSRGLSTMVVHLDDIYDEFAFGLRDPRAIRLFLTHAFEEWSRAPAYVALAGAGTYDHLDHLGLGGNLIPTLTTSRGDSVHATDVLYGDLLGDDGVPEVAVGRIPVLSNAELLAYVDKLDAYETSGGETWQQDVLLLADAVDDVADFGAFSRGLGGLLPVGYRTTEVHLDDQPDLATARQALMDGVADGAGWVNYSGHGGVDRLVSAGLLTLADLPLANAGRTPVLTSVTCHIGLHALPGFDSLGEELVLAETTGAVAVFAPTWLSDHSEARHLGDRLFREVFQQGNGVLGDAVRNAAARAAGLGLAPSVLRSYQLLGDPALRIQAAPGPDPAPTCEPDCGPPGG
ncbi:MAG: C25 family cysteine peptidase [Acidobacteriota bacterium]